MCASPHLAATRNSRLAPLPTVSHVRDIAPTQRHEGQRALCPAWATNAPPSNQSRFEVEYPGGTSQSSPTFPLPVTAGYPRYATSRTHADRKNPKASAARKVSPNFERQVKFGPISRTASRAPLNQWVKSAPPISASYHLIGEGNPTRQITKRPAKCRPFQGEDECNYCAALRGTDRGERAELTFDSASNTSGNGGRSM